LQENGFNSNYDETGMKLIGFFVNFAKNETVHLHIGFLPARVVVASVCRRFV
jgi:hypothetical protein